MAALIAIETVVLVLLTVLVAGLLRSHAAILARLHELDSDLDPDLGDMVEEARHPDGQL